MSEKYYTPEIEEFRVGFEYEMKATFGDGTVKTQQEYDNAEWQQMTYSSRSFPYVERTMIGKHPTAIRVKYLDKEDIESLGFKYVGGKLLSSAAQNYKFKTFTLINYDSIGVTIYEDHTIGYIFKGKIKNKSELKVLLKQLNII